MLCLILISTGRLKSTWYIAAAVNCERRPWRAMSRHCGSLNDGVMSRWVYHEGRPKKYTPAQINHAMELLENGNSYRKVEAMTGISKSTLIRAKRDDDRLNHISKTIISSLSPTVSAKQQSSTDRRMTGSLLSSTSTLHWIRTRIHMATKYMRHTRRFAMNMENEHCLCRR